MRSGGAIEVVRSATDADQWLATHLAARYAPSSWSTHVDRAELIGAGERSLRASHARVVESGVPAPAAATYLAAWYAGELAGALGYSLVAGGVGWLVSAEDVRWRLHPGGWPDAVRLGTPIALVTDDHPWADHPDVEVVASIGELTARTVAGLVSAVGPLVDACHGLARIGRPALWNEVADGLGGAVAYQLDLPVTQGMLDLLDRAVRMVAAPWRRRPALWLVGSEAGVVPVIQKGGCCLAYTRAPEAAEPAYCGSCSLRTADDCTGRQRAWFDREHRRAARGAP